MVRLLSAFALLLLSAPGHALDPRALAARVDTYVMGELTRQRIPGIAVAVIHHGEVLVAKGYGFANLEHRVPVKPETVFQSASVGKQFTAALVMLLAQDGVLSLGDPITTFYPDAPWRWRGITIRHLLTHTSGIPDYEESAIDLRKDYSEDELARFAFGLTLEFEPGARWSYSNTGYVLLGGIVRKATGRSYGDLLRERVFAPLGMRTARLVSEEEIVPDRSAGYRLSGGEMRNQEWVSPTLNATADGGLHLSIQDLVAWDAGIRAQALLGAEGWGEVFRPVTLRSGKTYPYGFGWFVDAFSGQLRQHHGGAWQGFKAYVSRHVGDDLTVAVLANLAEADPVEIANGLAALVDPRLAARDEPIPDRDPAVTERARRLLALAAQGKLSPALLAHVRAGFFPEVASAIERTLASAGSLRRLELLEAREQGDDRVYRYRATFSTGVYQLVLGLASDGGVSTFGLRPRRPRP